MKVFEVSGSVTNGFTYEIEAETEDDAVMIAHDLAYAKFSTFDCFDIDEINLLHDSEELK